MSSPKTQKSNLSGSVSNLRQSPEGPPYADGSLIDFLFLHYLHMLWIARFRGSLEPLNLTRHLALDPVSSINKP